MKKILIVVLLVACIMSLCACTEQKRETIAANGDVVEDVSYGEVIFSTSDVWTITKLNECTHYSKNTHKSVYKYSMVITNGEYVFYANINRELYATLNVGDSISAMICQLYINGSTTTDKMIYKDVEYYGSLYKV